jgi:multidrug resistance efflux pump
MNPQNIVRAIYAGSAAVVCVLAIKNHHSTVKNERAKREQIKLNTQRSLLAISRANLVVQRKVMAGEYDPFRPGRSINQIQTDMKFYEMIDRIDD